MGDQALPRYEAPPRPQNRAGATRRVGLEVEFGHLSLEASLQVVADALGGRAVAEDRTKGVVEGTPYGDFKVEYDSRPLKERAYLKPLERLGLQPDSSAADFVESSVLQVAREFVPVEIVTPPIEWDRLQELDPLWVALRRAGAEDTHSSVLHAFGLHLNPELPDLELPTILAHLRAFLLLEDWIRFVSDIDLSRLVAPYIHAFPEAYRRKVLDNGYAPDWDGFVDDYLEHNPTRNRPLDLLPLIVEALGVDLSARIDDDWALIKPRPTFHYRLPNCELTDPRWSPAVEWNRWVVVERLAGAPALLEELSEAYLSTFDLPLRMQSGSWTERIRQRLSDLPDFSTAMITP